ncbi:N-acetyltransferase family protein [Methylobacterium sp. JK268]
MPDSFTLRRLESADAAAFRDLRLEGLRDHPAAFGASFDEEAARPVAWFAERLAAGHVLGAWTPEGRLVGLAGLAFHDTAKLRHKALLWGVYLRPEARGTGLAERLIRRVLGEAGARASDVHLTVGAANAAARRLYARLGFAAYGTEPRALFVDGAFHDEIHMVLRVA